MMSVIACSQQLSLFCRKAQGLGPTAANSQRSEVWEAVTTNPTHAYSALMKSLHKNISVLAVCALMITLQSSQAQTFTVIHNFTGREDGGQPEYVAINPAGILYGTTALDQYGTVFKLKQVNSS